MPDVVTMIAHPPPESGRRKACRLLATEPAVAVYPSGAFSPDCVPLRHTATHTHCNSVVEGIPVSERAGAALGGQEAEAYQALAARVAKEQQGFLRAQWAGAWAHPERYAAVDARAEAQLEVRVPSRITLMPIRVARRCPPGSPAACTPNAARVASWWMAAVPLLSVHAHHSLRALRVQCPCQAFKGMAQSSFGPLQQGA